MKGSILIDAKRWARFTFNVQMGNIASEIARAIHFESQNNQKSFQRSLLRTIELIDLTIDAQETTRRLKELCRFRELVCDWYSNTKQYIINPESLKKYALAFGLLTRQ